MSVTSLSLPHLLLQIEQDPGGSTKPVPSAILCVMSCDPVDAQHPPAEETDCLRYMKGEDTYYPHGAQVGLGVCCLYSRWARVALGIPVPEFLQYTRCLFPNLQNWNDVNHPAVHSMVHPHLELSGSKSISEGTYLEEEWHSRLEGKRKKAPAWVRESWLGGARARRKIRQMLDSRAHGDMGAAAQKPVNSLALDEAAAEPRGGFCCVEAGTAVSSDGRIRKPSDAAGGPEEEPTGYECGHPSFINTDQNYAFGEDDLLIWWTTICSRK
nr:uncharacterized protein LOC116151548 [Camelus dromedarius]